MASKKRSFGISVELEDMKDHNQPEKFAEPKFCKADSGFSNMEVFAKSCESQVSNSKLNHATSNKFPSKSKIFQTSLHRKPTQSSISKTRMRTEILPQPKEVSSNPLANTSNRKILQRQSAIQNNSRESLTSDKNSVKVITNNNCVKKSSEKTPNAQSSLMGFRPGAKREIETKEFDMLKNYQNCNERVHTNGGREHCSDPKLRIWRQESGSVAKLQLNAKQRTFSPKDNDKPKGSPIPLCNGHKIGIMEPSNSPTWKIGNNNSQLLKNTKKAFPENDNEDKPLRIRTGLNTNKNNMPEVNNNHLQGVEGLIAKFDGGCCTPKRSFGGYPGQKSTNHLTGNQAGRVVSDDTGAKILQQSAHKKGNSANVDTSMGNVNKEKESASVRVVTRDKILLAENNGESCVENLAFVVPLESRVEVVEGSPLELWVKAKGARKVIWVKGSEIIPHAPPDFIYNSNPVDGIFSLKIAEVFLEDSGLYICELYGNEKGLEASSWCNVEVIEFEDVDGNDDESVVEIVEQLPTVRRKFVVPVIITTDMDPGRVSGLNPDDDEVASERRLFFANSSAQSSRDMYEDALEDIQESPDEDCDDLELSAITSPGVGGNRDPGQDQDQQKFECSKSSNLSDSAHVLLQSNEEDDKVNLGADLTLVPIDEILNLAVTPTPNTVTPKSAETPMNDPGRPDLQSQSSTESMGGSEERRSPLSEEKEFDGSGSSVENSGYPGTFRDSLSDNPLSPKFLMGPTNLIVMLGETVHLRVKIWTAEDSVTDIHWCKLVRGVYQRLDGKPETGNDSRIEITQPTNDLVMMTIQNVTYEDSGKYRVKINNSYGGDYHHCLVSVEGPPEPPASAPTAHFDDISGHIVVCWPCCPFDGGSAILKYILEMKMKAKSDSVSDLESWAVITPSSFKGLCFTLSPKDIKPDHTYHFRVCVENSHGKGKCSGTSDGIFVPSATDETSKNRRIGKMAKSLSGELPDYEYKNVELNHKDFLEYYEKHENVRLGKGRFGVVFKVTNKATNMSYAGKFVKCRKSTDKDRAELEYKIMNDLKYHPKLICLVDAFAMPREIVIVTEMINGGELFERVVADDFILTERDCVTFLRQICDGAKYIHDKNIMHLDLKPENILCTRKTSNQIKIIDFGLAQYYNPSEPISVLFGTAEFVSPEIINYDTICPATDMWSIGVITYILLSGLSPFLGDDDNETFSNITRGEFDFDDEAFDKVSEDAKDFISSLILKRKEQRLTAQECLEHKWLALSESEKTDIVLSTVKLKRFLLRRKWQKTGNAIRALGRITTLYSSSRRSSSGTSSSSVPSLSCPGGDGLRSSDSIEDSVFVGDPPLQTPASKTDLKTAALNNENRKREDFASKSRYDESCRSDSGIGGETLP